MKAFCGHIARHSVLGVRVKAQKDFKWVKGNADNQGYYIVNYDEAIWKNIIKQLQKDHEVSKKCINVGLRLAFEILLANVANNSIESQVR